MAHRHGLTARFWLAAAAGSMLYLRPANLNFCSAYADPPTTMQFSGVAACYDFLGKSEPGGHPDFGAHFQFQTDPTLDWSDLKTFTTDHVFGIDFPVSKLAGFAARLATDGYPSIKDA